MQSQDGQVIDESHLQSKLIKSILIDSVWSGHPVRFDLLTHDNRQYIAYYNADRVITAGQRDLNTDQFELHTLPVKRRSSKSGTSTVVGWDSHNSLHLATDKDGYIHMSGNMHVNGLTYFRSTVPADISTIVQVHSMTGSQEDRCTYPRFVTTTEGDLVFHYRDGGSGNGNEIYNIYDCTSQSWSRLLDVPLTDGQGLMNAYASGPRLGPTGWYHLYWVWRDTPDCSTNHDLSYMKSKDLKHWQDVHGQPVTLPATIEKKSLIVDPIPAKGGIINLAARLCFDQELNPIFVYHKYDAAGNLQLFIAHYTQRRWKIKQLTQWDYRWEFSGNGSINREFILQDFSRRDDGHYQVEYWHIKFGDGTLLLSEDLVPIGRVIKSPEPEIMQKPVGKFPGLQVQTASDRGSVRDGFHHTLKWETLDRNRDKPRSKPWPPSSALYLLEFQKTHD